MRVAAIVVAVVLTTALCTSAQEEWTTYKSIEDGFSVDFPGTPTIIDTFWRSERGFLLPARIYSAALNSGRYSITVVDYTPIRRLGNERASACPPGGEVCIGFAAGQLQNNFGGGYALLDLRGALLWATQSLLAQTSKLTALQYNVQDMIEGIEIHAFESDGSRMQAWVTMHENRLYVLKGTVPKNYPEPGLFQQSMSYLDKNGKGVRYTAIYSNAFHGTRTYAPPPTIDLSALVNAPGTISSPSSNGR